MGHADAIWPPHAEQDFCASAKKKNSKVRYSAFLVSNSHANMYCHVMLLLLLLPNCLHFNKRTHDFGISQFFRAISDSRELTVTQIKVKYFQIEFALMYLKRVVPKMVEKSTKATTFLITNTLERAIKMNKER